jgi:hypothetical protein
MTPNKRKSFGTFLDKRVFLLLISFQFLVFFPAVRNSSPWSDDWGYIYFAGDSSRNIVGDAVSAGRPILGILAQLAYQNEFVTRNPLVLQVVSVIGLFLLQFSLYSKLKNNGFANPILTLVPLLVILIPGIQGYVYFLSCFPYAWACVLGFLAFDFINSRTPFWIVIGGILLIIAFLIYPAGAMFYLVSYLIDLVARFRQERAFFSNIKHLFHILVKLMMCFAVSVVLAGVTQTYTDIKKAPRIELIDSLESFIEKVAWVSTRLFVSEFRVFTVASPTPTRAVIETTAILSLLVFFILKPLNGLTGNRALNFLLILFFPLLGAIPNLIILENQFEFRTLTATYAMSLIVWAYCFQEISYSVLRLKNNKKVGYPQYLDKLLGLICMLIVMFTVFHVQGDSRDLWVKPSLIRDNLTVSALSKIKIGNSDPICMIIPPKVYEPLNKLGVYSLKSDLASSWVPEPYMRLMLEQSNLISERKIFVVKDIIECDASSVVVNYKTLGMNN